MPWTRAKWVVQGRHPLGGDEVADHGLLQPGTRRAGGRRGGRCRLNGLYAQSGQPFLLLGRQLRPGARLFLPLQPPSDVITVHQHAGCDAGQDAAGFVGGEVGEDAVVALPVKWPWAVPVRGDGLQPLRAFRGPFRVFAEAAFASEVGHVLSDGHGFAAGGAVPDGVLVACVARGLVLQQDFGV
ncbi:hypothetical protein ACWD01_35590 [Streptomyces sp. NPDC002835]